MVLCLLQPPSTNSKFIKNILSRENSYTQKYFSTSRRPPMEEIRIVIRGKVYCAAHPWFNPIPILVWMPSSFGCLPRNEWIAATKMAAKCMRKGIGTFFLRCHCTGQYRSDTVLPDTGYCFYGTLYVSELMSKR